MQLAFLDLPIPAMAISPKAPKDGEGLFQTQVVLLIAFDDHAESYLCSPEDGGSLYFAHFSDVAIDNKAWLKTLQDSDESGEKEPCPICGHTPGEKEEDDGDED